MSQRGRLDRVATDALVDDIDRAIPSYVYVLRRCGGRALAEDLTSESILAAVDHINAGSLVSVDVGYLIGIARHKLVDHWLPGTRTPSPAGVRRGPHRRADRRPFRTGTCQRAVLSDLNPMQRAALTLRYVDDLPVGDVALDLLGRSVHATETLLLVCEVRLSCPLCGDRGGTAVMNDPFDVLRRSADTPAGSTVEIDPSFRAEAAPRSPAPPVGRARRRSTAGRVDSRHR